MALRVVLPVTVCNSWFMLYHIQDHHKEVRDETAACFLSLCEID